VSHDENEERRATLDEHLAWWGLKRFRSDREYFAWQRHQLSPADLNQLNQQAERKRHGDCRDEIAFYDLTAQARILPVLHSQRYEYYGEIGSRVASRLRGATRILDFGCGVGILTTFYARQFPGQEFVGVDRSPDSVAIARQKASELGLTNVRFDCVDVESEPLAGSYALVIATHALVQAEQDPGIPSVHWRTFERGTDEDRQAAFEQRSGIGIRLEGLSHALDRHARMIVCEKTRHLARRVPFQRALAGRGLRLVEQPEPIRYHLIEEVVQDGPLYALRRESEDSLAWNELPEPDRGAPFDFGLIQARSRDADAPLYENHWPSAQAVWEGLPHRTVLEETTRQESDGRQLHVELGKSEGLAFLYCANTFDQRQLVIVESDRASILEDYYREIVNGLP
jgi:tRNA G46 methylase TrmB